MMSEFRGSPYLAILSGKEEDRFTYFLRELLLSPAVLEHFLSTFCKLPAGKAKQARVDLRVSVTGGVPDLAVISDDTFLLFEAKVDSWLSTGQLQPYAAACDSWQQANPSGYAGLYLIASEVNIAQQVATGAAQVRAANLINWSPEGITWEQIAKEFQALAKVGQLQDAKLAMYLDEFARLVFYKFGELSRPFTFEESEFLRDATVPAILMSAMHLMEKTNSVLSLPPYNLGGSQGNPCGRNFIGYGVKGPRGSGWFGLWLDVWQKMGRTPLVLQFTGLPTGQAPNVPSGLEPPVTQVVNGSTLYFVPLDIRPEVPIFTLANEHAALIHRYFA